MGELLDFKYALRDEYQKYHDKALAQGTRPLTYDNWLENKYFAELRETEDKRKAYMREHGEG